MPGKKLREFLDANSVKYVVISHSPAYTAQEIAASAHITGKEIAKTVMVSMDGKLTMAVLPASHRVDLDLLEQAAGGVSVRLATEEEFEAAFPDCEVGAMPPFGNLYGMKVFVADALARDKEIAFNAASHRELVKLSYMDFERLVKPQVAAFSLRR
jgi:Ala-tRNA(Pro) deacylase